MTPTLAPSLSRNGATPAWSHSFAAEMGDLVVTVELVNITPEIAAEYLTKNVHNRNLRERSVTAYASAMASGDWTFTAAPITFDDDGSLVDGQHRLHAIIRSECPQWTLVVTGLMPEAQNDTDRGVGRKFTDVLSMRGEANAGHLAALVRKAYMWENGTRRFMNTNAVGTAPLLRCLDAHPELRDLIQPGRRVGDLVSLPGSLVSLAWWVFAQIDQEDADFFFERLGDGQGLVKGDPIFELRRTIMSGSANAKGERSQTYLLAIVIKAWNAYRSGETVGLYRWKPGGAKPEAFPEPK